ncbi:Rpn family recombination-promoting nuclease/putative transposase [Lentibacillus sp. CBA3610]|uniref:Rpn family recombination-promoting nuclease/putative transposase n=1 Tax=Lentibacillus sp. CBA3610 TaxID=2518176 RepID=UPI0020D240FA|nr:Rpn family recombination-promoting nuclease/putative transposase [Lentibacillus sp. CBA3610]
MALTKPVEETADFTKFVKVREESDGYNGQKETEKRGKLLKRIPLEKLMDLKVDYAFKQLFGNEKNKEITVVFLNAILQRTGRKRITDISFDNTEVGREYDNDKKSRLDLLVRTEDNEWVNVEIQFTNKYDMVKRSLYYWSKIYSARHEKGMSYTLLRPVIAVNIMNFNLFTETGRFHTSYHLYEDEERFKLTNMMEFHFIEMPKLIKEWKADKLDPWNNVLARWLMMLGMVDSRNDEIYNDIYKELEVIAMHDDQLRNAFENWEELSMTQEQRLAYESRLKQIMDEESFKRDMEDLAKEIEKKELEVERKEQEIAKKNQEIVKKHQEIAKKNQEAVKKNQEAAETNQEAEKQRQEAEKIKREGIQLKKETENRLEETARKLLEKGMELEFVTESTGLTWDRITEIRKEMRK